MMDRPNSKKEELFRIIGTLHDDELRGFVSAMLNVAPPSFWTKRASKSHHPKDEQGEFGNLLHTVRVVKITLVLLDAVNATQVVRDLLVASAILHDLCRYGLDDSSEFTDPEHPHLVRRLAEKHSIASPWATNVFALIEVHTGRWGNPPYLPTLRSKDILHIADVVAARLGEVLC